MNDLSSISVLILSILGNGILGYLVLRKNPKSASHIIFTVLNADLFVYAILNFLANRQTDPVTALFLIRILMLLAVTQVVAMYLFLRTFPNERFHLPRSSFAYLAVTSVICMALALSPWLFRDVVFENGAPLPIAGWGMIVYMPLLLSMIVAGTISVIRKFRSAQGLLRIQLTYIIIGLATMTGLFVSLNFFAVVFFKNANFTVFAPLYILFFLACSAVAILKYRFLDSRIIIRKGILYSLSALFATLIYGWILSYFETLTPLPSSVLWITGPLFFLAGFEGIKKIVRALLDRYIFTDALDPSNQLDFEKRFQNVQGELNEWFAEVSKKITDALGDQEIKLFLVDRVNHDLIQFSPRGKARFSENHEGVQFLTGLSEPVLLSALLERKGQSPALNGFFTTLKRKGEVVAPLAYHQSFLGFILLDSQELQRIYSAGDLLSLSQVSSSFTRSLNESLTYSEALQKLIFLDVKKEVA